MGGSRTRQVEDSLGGAGVGPQVALAEWDRRPPPAAASAELPNVVHAVKAAPGGSRPGSPPPPPLEARPIGGLGPGSQAEDTAGWELPPAWAAAAAAEQHVDSSDSELAALAWVAGGAELAATADPNSEPAWKLFLANLD